METHYTDEKNTQMVLDLLKQHGIKKVIASPGTTNIRLVASMQQDKWFEMYSAPDERSAAYMACGMAEESSEPVVITCTGATASRNYIPGLTEAFYRKIPVLAITSAQYFGNVGQNIAQVLDRSKQLNDICKYSVQIQSCNCEDDEWNCNLKINEALLELKRNGGGPVHINLETKYSKNFSIEKLPTFRKIDRYGYEDKFPIITQKRIGIFIGNHSKMPEKLINSIDCFCEKYNAVVLKDHTSNYNGKYGVLFNIVTNQTNNNCSCNNFDLIIHIGNTSGAYPYFHSKEEWRVNEDGEIRDTFRNLKYVFAVKENYFFEYYNKLSDSININFYNEWNKQYYELYNKINNLPLSNLLIASKLSKIISQNSIIHFGILNSLRSWNYFKIDDNIRCYCNTGGFGIDGILSSAIGAALANKDKTIFCILGDLAFFYDMNSLGNRHLPNNLKIVLINNGVGTEFKNYNHYASQFGNDSNEFIAAAGHYGNKSPLLVKNYCENLNFNYFSIDKVEEIDDVLDKFIKCDSRSIVEIFTVDKDESVALKIVNSLNMTANNKIKSVLKDNVKKIIGPNNFENLKRKIKK